MGRLAPTLLTLIIGVYLLSLRGKTIRTYLLAGYFVGLTLFNFGHLYAYSVFDPAGRWGWYLVSGIGFALIFKTRFAYFLPGNTFPREERVALWVTVVLSSAAWLEYVVRSGLTSTFYFESQFYGAPFVSTSVPVVAFLIFAWGLVVLLRQSFAGGGVHYGALGFVVLTVFELLSNAVVLLQRFEIIPEGDDAIAIGMNMLLLLLFFSYALLYLNLSSEPSSFVAKLVGISLVTVMVVISSLGLHQTIQAEYEYDRERKSDLRLAIQRGANGRPINAPERLGRDASGHRHPGAVRYIARIQPDGSATLLYSLDDETELKYPARPPEADGAPLTFDRRYRQLGDQIYVAFQSDYSAVLPGDVDAVFEVGFDYRAYRNHLHKIARTYCYAILLVVAFMLLVFPLFFRATVTRPMQQLLGLLEQAEPEHGQNSGAGTAEDELALLSRTFARMMGLLKEAKSRFYEYSEHIEEVERIVSSHGGGETILREVGDRSLLYASGAMREVIKQADRFATFDRPVLVTGETGTGKELIARLIHQAGPRAERPFVAVNCAAIPGSLWESEIFGHVRGAFTDARSDRSGRVAEAENGTLFFDEIGEMPLEMQAKLLRLLQERVYHPVGGDESKPARCRFLFATNRDLLQMAEAGGFREDLYYRINVFQVNIPPLRDRRADIPVLADHILKTICDEAGMDAVQTDPAAMNAIVAYRWPGNIRELENTLMRSLAVSSQGFLKAADLPPAVARSARPSNYPGAHFAEGTAAPGTAIERSSAMAGHGDLRANASAVAANSGPDAPFLPPDQNFDLVVKGFSKRLIEEALHRSGGNKTRAAELLGMKRNRLRYQIKELNIED